MSRGDVVRRAALLALMGVSLYILAPTLIEVFSSFDRLADVEPWWFVAIIGLQVGSVTCLCAIQRLALRTDEWFPVVTSQLAGAAFGRVVPGGGATAAAMQYSMLLRAGLPASRAASALTATQLLLLAGLLALPVLTLPAIAAGVAVPDSLEAILWFGLGTFVILSVLGGTLLAREPVLRRIATLVQRANNRVRRRHPRDDLPDLLAAERRIILGVLGRRWWEALLLTAGKWMLDLLTLMAAILAVGGEPSPILVLLAYCTSQILVQVPATPGGLGFVEAGLTATLALTGITAGEAVVATLAYRLASYWLHLPAGAIAATLHRRRYQGARAAPEGVRVTSG